MREINKNPIQWIEEAIEESIDNLRYLVEALNRLKKSKMIMTKEFVKEWVYECVARFTFKNPSVEKLAKTGTPPPNATVEIEQNSYE